ncbi:MAG: DUF4910 domain-containing protein, partial [Erysipelotrichaceae bacterium]|nr:DUF4910 domain-containing protein [Erysipelotrichaceae bacterium]
KSYPIDLRNDPVDLVLLDKGADEKNYEDIDFAGKWVFIRGMLNSFNWVYDRGALGVVTDFIMETANRSRSDLYNSLTYTSYWHDHHEGEKEKRGFVLSPKTGDKLAELCRKKWNEEKKYLQVRPYIDSSLYNGHIEDVEVTIEGKDDKVVYLSAHLCHPRSSCNDNASGVSATLEAMNVMNTLIKEGKLDKPQHTIKLTLIPEFTGTFAYFSDHTDYEKGIGAMNLDMVGGKQTRFYGPITLTKTPLALPNLINELSTYALQKAGNEAASLSGDPVNLTNNRVEPHSGGSDHTVYCDPTIGIPCCMLGQWPDLNYHTATDTLDVIDPEVLKFSTLTAINFAWNLANLSEDDLPYLFDQLDKNMTADKNRMTQKYLAGKIDKKMFGSAMYKLKQYYIDSVKTASRLIDKPVDTSKQEKKVAAIFDAWIASEDLANDFCADDTLSKVYKRNAIGPVHQFSDYRTLGYGKALDEYQEKTGGDRFKLMGLESNILYYIDGKRTMGEVIREVELETGKTYGDLSTAFFKLLSDINLISEV